jgi:nucleotide-binding universal stress UspA family protein
MFKKILVGYEGSERSEDALALAHELAADAGDITAACSYWYEPLTARVGKSGPGGEAMRGGAEEVLAPLAARGITTVAAPGSSPAAALHDLAEHGGFDLVVLGSTHSGRIGQVLSGTTATHLLHGAPCAVAVAPLGYHRADHAAVKRIGVAYSDTPAAHEALTVAHALAAERHAELVILDAADRDELEMSGRVGFFAPYADSEIREAVADELREAVSEVEGGEVRVTSRMLLGPPGRRLAEETVELDALVMGSRGYGGVRRALLGSVSRHVINHAACPVLVVPRGVHPDLAPGRVVVGAAAR